MSHLVKIFAAIICAAIVIVIAISTRPPNHRGSHSSAHTQFGVRRANAAFTFNAERGQSTRPSATYNFHAAMLNLLAPFETPTASDDPFLREKRADSLQTAVEQFSAAETAFALEAIESIHTTNPTEAATDLRDRLLQRSRELNPHGNMAPAVPEPDSPATAFLALSETDPITAATLALQQLPPDREQQNILIGILQRWAALDPQAAHSWANQFPESDLRTRAFTELHRLAGPPSQ